MTYLILKSLHLIFVVTWFAGLFYLGRLLIYYREASEKAEPERKILSDQFILMTKRLLFIICFPSMFLVIGFGLVMIMRNPSVFTGWMHIKLALVGGLVIYQVICVKIYSEMKKGSIKWTILQLRIWNELVIVFLFAIVFLAVMKSTVDMLIGVAGIVGLIILLMLGIKLYQHLGE